MTDPRPAECCGKCPPISGGGYDCTCTDNPRCPNTDPVALTHKWDASDLTDVGLVDVLDCALRLADEVTYLRATTERVRRIHQPIDALNTDTGHTVKACSGCGTDNGNRAHWPCRTIRALGQNPAQQVNQH